MPSLTTKTPRGARRWTRRAFIGAGTVVGGGFVLGVAELAFAPNRLTIKKAAELNTWITVTPDDVVSVLIPHCEMGQGAQTALAMIAAEEMGADWSRVRVKEAPALDEYANEYVIRGFVDVHIPSSMLRGFDYATYRLMRLFGVQVTGGSSAVRGTGVYGMAVAGAAARDMLLAAAARRWSVAPSECAARDSRIVHTKSNRTATFGEIRIPADGKRLRDIEREALELTLQLTDFNQSAAARILCISRPTLARKLRAYGLAKDA